MYNSPTKMAHEINISITLPEPREIIENALFRFRNLSGGVQTSITMFIYPGVTEYLLDNKVIVHVPSYTPAVLVGVFGSILASQVILGMYGIYKENF